MQFGQISCQERSEKQLAVVLYYQINDRNNSSKSISKCKTKQMKQKTFSLLAGVIICALLLPVRVIGRLQHPDIEAN